MTFKREKRKLQHVRLLEGHQLLPEVAIGRKSFILKLGLEVLLANWSRGQVFYIAAGSSQSITKSIAFVILLTRFSWSGVKTPLGPEGLVNFLGLAELKVADLLGNGGALSNRVKLGNQLGLEAAGLLRVQVTGFLRDINKGGDNLIMALLISLLSDASSTTDFNWKLLTLGVTNKLARLLLNVLGGARGFIDSAALLRTLAIANLFDGSVAFLHSLIESLLLEGDLTSLLEVLLANLLLGRRELCDIGVVTLLNILVGALKDGILLEGLDSLLLLNATQPSFRIILAGAEVDSSLDLNSILSASAKLVATVSSKQRFNFVC